jgi:outer membrane protein OmpA-like peptidoglycan-associated protein
MLSAWHDINAPSFSLGKSKASKQNTPIDEPASDNPSQKESEVRLVSASWEAGEKGFAFNEKCNLLIKAEFIKPTKRKKVTCELFAVYNGTEENLSHQVEAYLNDAGKATAEMTLYYGNAYHEALQQNPAATCSYRAKITHSTAVSVLESELLEMPHVNRLSVDFVEVADVHFNHNCALPCLDAKGDLISELASAFAFSSNNADRELVVEGHADTSGDPDSNLRISKRRAEAVKALLDNDPQPWNAVAADTADHKVEVEDYQLTLKSLADKFGWPCNPGEVDNKDGPKTQEGVKNFQQEYNKRFGQDITVDGKVGPQTWESIFNVLRKLLDEELKKRKLDPAPKLTYGYPDGKGIYPCGECSPIENSTNTNYRSQKNRRVELVFYKKGEVTPVVPPAGGRTVDKDTDPVTENPWNKVPVAIDETGGKAKIPLIKIDALDKWFIPGPADKGGEICTIKYTLDKADGFAGKVVMEVYASNYCKAEMKEDYSVSFSALDKLVPVFTLEMPPERAEPGKQHEITDWNGKSTATDGCLKPRDGAERFINVAFSPYTIHFRSFSDDTGKEARIDLLDFWPRWKTDDQGGGIDNDSLKIKWKIEKCDKLKKGMLHIVDKTDSEVFKKDLADADLSEGAHEFQWDGALTSGGQLAKEKMPYRVQVRAWTDESEQVAVAIAAMHTEVRLFVHPDTGKNPNEPWKDPNSLKFGLAPFTPVEPQEADGEKWYQYKLAQAGFHPGPIDGTIGNLTKSALQEFQRSNTKNTSAPYQRLDPSGNLDSDTREAIKFYKRRSKSICSK